MVDPANNFHYHWLFFISCFVLYNIIIIVGRSVFWELQNLCPVFWYFMDYTSDFIYICDMALHARAGMIILSY